MEQYEALEIEVVLFDKVDIIVTSGCNMPGGAGTGVNFGTDRN